MRPETIKKLIDERLAQNANISDGRTLGQYILAMLDHDNKLRNELFTYNENRRVAEEKFQFAREQYQQKLEVIQHLCPHIEQTEHIEHDPSGCVEARYSVCDLCGKIFNQK